jgi:hypothetical protein
MLFWSMLVFDQARPEMSTILTKVHQIAVRQHWLAIVYEKLMVLLWFCAIISFVCLGLNWYLRKTNNNISWLPQVLLMTVSMVAMLVLTIWRPLMQ